MALGWFQDTLNSHFASEDNKFLSAFTQIRPLAITLTSIIIFKRLENPHLHSKLHFGWKYLCLNLFEIINEP